VLLSGFPGEAYPNISVGVAGVVAGEGEHFPLGLANDQLGYLISPAEAFPTVAAEGAVNHDSIFNVSPTIGDHVMCASARLAAGLYEEEHPNLPARCRAFAASDAATTVMGTPTTPWERGRYVHQTPIPFAISAGTV
jgi:hypothetical protein